MSGDWHNRSSVHVFSWCCLFAAYALKILWNILSRPGKFLRWSFFLIDLGTGATLLFHFTFLLWLGVWRLWVTHHIFLCGFKFLLVFFQLRAKRILYNSLGCFFVDSHSRGFLLGSLSLRLRLVEFDVSEFDSLDLVHDRMVVIKLLSFALNSHHRCI